jgi:Ca2+-binding RTX toxin-like protein
MIGVFAFLLTALLVLPSCTDTETVRVDVPGDTKYVCPDGTTEVDDRADCPPPEVMYDQVPAGTTADMPYGVGDSDDMVQGTDGPDFIKGEAGDDTIKGMGGNDDITGDAGNDTIYGGDGDDKLAGNAGNDTIYGGDGDDKLAGNAGNDMLDGGAGDDELTGGSGTNRLDGGDGSDFAIFLGADQVSVNLVNGGALVRHAPAMTAGKYLAPDSGDTGVGTDTLANIENVKGTHGHDYITGNENANVLKGLDGDDIINGLDGDDIILPNRPAMLNADGTAMVANTAVLDPINAALVTAGDDPATTDGIDVVDGGDGTGDTISYEGERENVTVDLLKVIPAVPAAPDASPPTPAVPAHVQAVVTKQAIDIIDMIAVTDIGTEDEPNVVSTIENVVGGFGADTLTGDARANMLSGGADGDILTGNAGDDILMGGAGDDMLMGGDGNDVLDGGTGRDTLNGGDGDDVYEAVNPATNSEGGDSVSDTVTDSGGTGDMLYYAAPDDDTGTPAIDESDLGAGVSGAAQAAPAGIEMVFGTEKDDYIDADSGGGGAILGRAGDDTLTGAAGADTLVGCAGSNTLTDTTGGSDVFGVVMGSTANTISDFSRAAGNMDEIHLKGFPEGSTHTVSTKLNNITHAAVIVGGVEVAAVTNTTLAAIPANPEADPPVLAQSVAEQVVVLLNQAGAVSFDFMFDAAEKCE